MTDLSIPANWINYWSDILDSRANDLYTLAVVDHRAKLAALKLFWALEEVGRLWTACA